MRRLKKAVFRPELCAGSHTHATDQAAAKIRKDVTEHVLHYQAIELPGLPPQIECHRIDIVVVGADIRMERCALVEDLSEERERIEHICFVDAGDATLASARLALPGERECRVAQPLGDWSGHEKNFPRFPIVDNLTAPSRME